jgi:endogenous inhibitor of DNA gyrase (YacG/DUF329 family)
MRAIRKGTDDSMILAAVAILDTGQSSKFQYEGAVRHGLRAGLCLDGIPWSSADNRASRIVERALQKIGAARPTWQEAQPDHTDDRMVERWHCKNCGRPVALGKNGRPRKYCSDECLQIFHVRMNFRYGARQSRAEYLAACVANRKLREHGERDCARCGKLFLQGSYRDRTYCSPECASAAKRDAMLIHEDRPCTVCGTLFRPRTVESKYCSRRCEADGKRQRPDSAECRTCGKVFAPDSVGQKFCCHSCFTTSRRVTRPELQCPICATVFRPRNATNPNRFCSRTCANRSRAANGPGGFLCEASEKVTM